MTEIYPFSTIVHLDVSSIHHLPSSEEWTEILKVVIEEPFEGLVAKAETGVGLCIGKEDIVDLPMNRSKRGLYKRFCEKCNWNVVTDAK